MIFDETYTRYWASAVKKSVDGTVIAGQGEADHFLQYVKIERHDRVLDLGCSFGRMYEVLAKYSDRVYGIDPDPFAVGQARLQPYEEVHQGSAENTGFDKNAFDIVFCWAVFDVVDHIKGLTEINRIMKKGGKLLLTGKNVNYHPDDALAFNAEKNAFLKGYPNRFTNLNAILKSFMTLGFQLDTLFIFPRRGDFGLLNFSKCIDDVDNEYIGYEYLILCHKVADQDDLAAFNALCVNESIESQFSKTATKIATESGYVDAKELFERMGID